ncbi:MAG: M42 family metallopeptidase [ANME-2 cluster archaeon]|nr:M42 family metallopeptidase [ANME-2 cluster archaeon]
MEQLNEMLKRFSNTHGVSGYEGNIRQLLEEKIKPYVDEVRTDKLGNLMAIRKGGHPSVMIAAHMDEIGLMCKYVDEKGFVHFVKLGGWFDQTLHSQRVILHTENGDIYGVIGAKPPHAMKEDERKKPVKAEDMFIDIGAKDQKDAERLGVIPGTTVTLDRQYASLGNNRVTGKCFDDRAGIVMMIEAMRLIHERNIEATVYAVGTVQEEVGLKGARTSAFGLNPSVALVSEVTVAGDHPGIEKKQSAIELSKGPSITILDAGGRGLIATENVIKWLKETAKEYNIDIQPDVAEGGTTDATAIHLTKCGIPSSVISIPSRYIHSPVEVLDLEDLKKGAQLLARAVETVSKHF